MAKSKLTWNGKAVSAKMKAAQQTGVNQTMAEASAHAKNNHAWQNQTAALEGGIGIVDYAAPADGGVKGTWGVQDIIYARIQEEGGTIVPKNAKALAIPQSDGGVAFVKSVTIPARPYLRPAADAKYPGLIKNIRVAYQSGNSGAGGARG